MTLNFRFKLRFGVSSLRNLNTFFRPTVGIRGSFVDQPILKIEIAGTVLHAL